MKKFAMIALMSVMASGCATQTYTLSAHSQATPSYDKAQTFFVSGIGQEQEVDAAQICGGNDKVAKVQTQQTFLNGLLGFVTSGIYTPRQARVFCK
ncbi:Bor family protein [Moraxella marmotae]|uniref:Bor family protein n=1 Tax=Moraxella marmotae TaxID=3344520 RepID=UPI0035F4FBBE